MTRELSEVGPRALPPSDSFLGLQVKKMIPILSDFQASITGDNQFEISWLSKKRETREYVADSAESLGVLLRTASKLVFCSTHSLS